MYVSLQKSSLTKISARGLRALWRGKKYEERHTQVAIILWQDLALSHAFFTSERYYEFNKLIQPAMNGRKIDWQNHAILDTTGLDDIKHLINTLNSPSIEVALTKVVEGGVNGYYNQFRKIVVDILNDDPGCDGYYISPKVENPQDQLLLINWKSVDVSSASLQPYGKPLTSFQAHHEDFEKKPTFKACIDGLKEYYAVFVVPWHIVDLKLVAGNL